MNKYTVPGLLLLAGSLLAQAPAATPPSTASAAIPTRVCVINLQSAMTSTKEGQAAAEVFRTRMEPKEKEIQAMQAEITELNDKKQRGANTLSQTAIDELQRSIDRKSTDYKRAVEDYQFDREDEQRKLLDELSAKMQSVIDKFAQTSGCAVLLDVTNPNTGVMWVSTAADMTQQVVEAYDKAQPAPVRPATPAKPPASGTKPPASSTPAAPPKATPPAGKQ